MYAHHDSDASTSHLCRASPLRFLVLAYVEDWRKRFNGTPLHMLEEFGYSFSQLHGDILSQMALIREGGCGNMPKNLCSRDSCVVRNQMELRCKETRDQGYRSGFHCSLLEGTCTHVHLVYRYL